MIRIAALNDDSSGSGEESTCAFTKSRKVTSEAQENAAYSLYNKALSQEKQGLLVEAYETFNAVLSSGFITKQLKERSHDGQLVPSLVMKFSTLKNVSHICSQLGKYDEAIKALLEAMELDSTDISVCYKLGVLAKKTDNFLLALEAFKKGLAINSQHWPCLDNLLSILYVLNNYEVCMCHIARALVRDSGYIKALVLRKYMLIEQPSLKQQLSHAFTHCDMEEVERFTEELQAEEENEVMDEVRMMRETQRRLAKSPPTPTVELQLCKKSWLDLGRRLVKIFRHIEENSFELNHGIPVVMNMAEEKTNSPTKTQEKQCNKDPVFQEPMEIAAIASIDNSTIDSTDSLLSARSHDAAIARSISQYTGLDVTDDASQLSHLSALLFTASEDMSNTSALSLPSLAAINERNDVDLLMEDLLNQLSPEKERLDYSLIKNLITDMVNKVCSEYEERHFLSVQASRSDHGYAKTPERSQPPAEKRGSRRKRTATPSSAAVSETRRSSRVKHTKKLQQQRQQETEKTTTAQHIDELRKLIPISMLHERTAEHGYHKPELTLDVSTDKSNAQSLTTSTVKELDNEEREVLEFIERFSDNFGVLHLIREWLAALCEKRQYKWPDELLSLYLEAYEIKSECCQRPNIFSDMDVEMEAMVNLLAMEIKVDKMEMPSPSTEQIDQYNCPIGYHFFKDLTYWDMILKSTIKLPNHCLEYSARFYWMAAKFYTAVYKPDIAVNIYSELSAMIERCETHLGSFKDIALVNIDNENLITGKTVTSQLEGLQRASSLEELHTLYDRTEHSKVMELIIPTFNTPLKKRYSDARFAQLLVFVKTLTNTTTSGSPLKWMEEILNEALHHYNTCHIDKETWFSLVKLCFDELNNLISSVDKEVGNISTENFHSMNKVRLVRNSLEMIEKCLLETANDAEAAKTPGNKQTSRSANQQATLSRAPSTESQQKIQLSQTGSQYMRSVLPWIVLHSLVAKDEMLNRKDNSEEITVMLNSIRILLEAHDTLGERSLCTSYDGILLQTLARSLTDLCSADNFMLTGQADQHIQQCFYCLYGHPHKKIKARNLQDHGSAVIPLTWSEAQFMFNYFKPHTLPEFDSFKSSTISAELEYLFRRIITTVPASLKPDKQAEQLIDAYLTESATNQQIDDFTKTMKDAPTTCSEAYYLLADYYFKNKEPLKAVKHYTVDLYYSPARFDAWAGMALAKSSKLESRLNIMERQSFDGAFQKLAVSAMQAFARALHLHTQNSKLWIEYAVSAYQLHSYASRALKSRTLELSQSETESFVTLRSDMLSKSKTCYLAANQVEDGNTEELWLHHYMLGKIAEKTNQSPDIYLSHYKKASLLLDEEGACYPQRISYMYNPPYLAVEALEIYYRIHACALKLVQQTPNTPHLELLQRSVTELKDSPFTTAHTGSQSTTSQTSPGPNSQKKRPASTASSAETRSPVTKRRKSGAEVTSQQSLTSELMQPADDIQPADVTQPVDVTQTAGITQRVHEEVKQVVEELISRVLRNQEIGLSGQKVMDKTESTQSSAKESDSNTEEAVRLKMTEILDEIDEKLTSSHGSTSREHKQEPSAAMATGDECGEGATPEQLTSDCIEALKLCIQRYPLHYKSYYRLAKTYLHDKNLKDLDIVNDLLLGNTAKKKEEKFVAQGLFQDRKHNNFFNGVWRIPVEEIERAGSFGAHLYKTIYLLLQFLHEKRDYNLLYQLHTQLQRTPDQEKKFLKDTDRLYLASRSIEFAIHSLYKVIGTDVPGRNEANYLAYLHQAYKWFNYCNKNSTCVPNSQVLLIKAYKSYKLFIEPNAEFDAKIQVTVAKEFCQQKFSTRKDRSKASELKANQTDELSKTQSSTIASNMEQSSTAHEPVANKLSTLPSVRGSFQTFDVEKSKKSKPNTKTNKPDDLSLSQNEAQPTKTLEIPASSWLHKAKEGTAALADMFNKSSNAQPHP